MTDFDRSFVGRENAHNFLRLKKKLWKIVNLNDLSLPPSIGICDLLFLKTPYHIPSILNLDVVRCNSFSRYYCVYIRQYLIHSS